MSDLLINAEVLRSELSEPGWVVFDVRYSLSDPKAGETAYLAGHIPGAYFLDHGTQLAGRSTGTNGRHPLPEQQGFKRLLQTYGLTPRSKIVVYDHGDGSFAARAWWLLRWQGYADVRILDGGLQAWKNAGGTLQTSVPAPAAHYPETPEDAAVTMPTVSVSDVLPSQSNEARVLVDARSSERYRGEVEPIDPVAGRIEGALNRPIAHNVRSDGHFKAAAQLREEFETLLGSTPGDQVIHYCGSGITACHNIFAMELAGLGGSALYPGSWSEWCSDSTRPIATGKP